MKRLSADDSADSRVKVGHRQANLLKAKPLRMQGLLLLSNSDLITWQGCLLNNFEPAPALLKRVLCFLLDGGWE